MKMETLKNSFCDLASVIPDESKIVYLDYPVHMNVGDLLIMKGTEAYFKAHNFIVEHRLSIFGTPQNLQVINNISHDVIIVLHGGGNFGDLYPIHQRYREEIIRRFPNNKIVMLPQTAFFKSKEEMLLSAKIFNSHGNLHLFARDEQTLKLFKDHFTINAYLSADMAHQLWGWLPVKVYDFETSPSLSDNVLYLIRSDIEASDIPSSVAHCTHHFVDWSNFISAKNILLMKLVRKLSTISHGGWLNILAQKVWYHVTDDLIFHLAQKFITYDYIVTSRLHGHIFACLLGINNLIIDNSYGKNSGYFKLWTSELDGAKLDHKVNPNKEKCIALTGRSN